MSSGWSLVEDCCFVSVIALNTPKASQWQCLFASDAVVGILVKDQGRLIASYEAN